MEAHRIFGRRYGHVEKDLIVGFFLGDFVFLSYNSTMRRIAIFLISGCLFILVAGASADTIGQGQVFFISSRYDLKSRNMLAATLRHETDRAYFYVADDYWNAVNQDARDRMIGQIKLLAQEFDDRIYPQETQFFGFEPNPGVDNDPRITILLAPLIENAGGYFNATNEYSKQVLPDSNEREMIYLNISEINNLSKMFVFLGHEFQHLISFNQKEKLRGVPDDVWLNELRSEYAPVLLGYNDNFENSNLQRRLRSFSNDPADSLTEWKNLPADYGQIGLFGEYIAERWSPQIIADTLQSNLAGIPSINEALARNNFKDSFIDLYGDWLTANVLNDSTIDSRFGYARNELKNFRIIPAKVLNNLGDNGILMISDLIKDWQARWYEISQFSPGQKGVLKVGFSSPSLASFLVRFMVFKSGSTKSVGIFDPLSNAGVLHVAGIGTDFDKIILMPIKKDKLAGFGSDETAVQLTTSVERVDFVPLGYVTPTLLTDQSAPTPFPTLSVRPAVVIPDGSLIRAEGDFRIYVVQGRWRRHIISPAIFKFYSHLGFDKVITVQPSVLSQYADSDLIRYPGSQRVYIVDTNGKRHWLNISARQFALSGRNGDAIFSVNLRELNFYKVSGNITR